MDAIDCRRKSENVAKLDAGRPTVRVRESIVTAVLLRTWQCGTDTQTYRHTDRQAHIDAYKSSTREMH